MKFLLGANMPRSALAALRSFGHSADHVRDIGLGDATDDRVAAGAVAAAATLVSRDLDFADVRRFPPQNTQGILVLRLPDDTLADEIAAVMNRLLGTTMVALLPGHLAVRGAAETAWAHVETNVFDARDPPHAAVPARATTRRFLDGVQGVLGPANPINGRKAREG